MTLIPHAEACTPYVLVVSLARLDPMCTLFFTHLAGRAPLRVAQYPGRDVAGLLGGASALIVVRGLFEFGNLIPTARRLRVPLYYFQDDNFMLIRNETGTYGTIYDRYTDERVRSELAPYAGVLLATESLVTYFREQRLHDRLSLYPPVVSPIEYAPIRSAGQPLTVAFFGGAHRREPFARYVYPALCRLAMTRPIRLVAAGLDAGGLPSAGGLTIEYPSYDPSYAVALKRIAGYGVDILVHPSAETANNIYKNPHVLINARSIGATPIFSDMPPYNTVRNEGVAILCENTEEAWFEAVARLASDRAQREAIRARLVAYCDRHFGGAVNVAVIDAVLNASPAPGTATRVVRQMIATIVLSAGGVRRRAGAAMKRPRHPR